VPALTHVVPDTYVHCLGVPLLSCKLLQTDGPFDEVTLYEVHNPYSEQVPVPKYLHFTP